MIVVLTGGTGGAKFVEGLRQVASAQQLTFIVNTGDDLEWWGLYVSPDLDSITYAMAGLLSKERGWGVKGDTFFCLQAMGELARAHLVPRRRPRPRGSSAALEISGAGKNIDRSHNRNLQQACRAGADFADEQLTS